MTAVKEHRLRVDACGGPQPRKLLLVIQPLLVAVLVDLEGVLVIATPVDVHRLEAGRQPPVER